MRKQKEIQLNVMHEGTELTLPVKVFELTAIRVKNILDQPEGVEKKSTQETLLELLPHATSLTMEDIEKYDLAPSDIELVWLAFKEVNASFFSLLEATGLAQVLKEGMLDELQKLARLGLVMQSVSS